MSNELKRCPFCGGEAQMISRMDEDIWSHNTVEWCYVECKECCVRTDPWPKHDRNPIEAWNRRASQPVRQSVTSEPVYAFRRKGQDSFCTCDVERYEELADKPNLFEVTVFYTSPTSEPVGKIVTFGESLKEVSWRKGKMPEVGTELFDSPQPCSRCADNAENEAALMRQIKLHSKAREDAEDKLAALEAENARLTAELNLASGMAKAFQTEVAQQAERIKANEQYEQALKDDCRTQVSELQSKLAALEAKLTSYRSGKCVRCGNPNEHIVGATASVGVSPPEGFPAPPPVESRNQGGGQIATPLKLAALEAENARLKAFPKYDVFKTAEVILSDCGCSTEHAALLEKVRDRLFSMIDATIARQAERINRLEALIGGKDDMSQAILDGYEELREQLAAAEKVVEAAQNLVSQKGRYNTELSYKRLSAAIAAHRAKGAKS